MKKVILLGLITFIFISGIKSQDSDNQDLRIGLMLQKTEALYWENGIAVNYANSSVFDKQLHFKAAILSSSLGSALGTNAINQHSISLGADWHFLHNKKLQIPVGFNLGYFIADYENTIFDVLPSSSALFSLEAGLSYSFDFPVTLSLSAGYNFRNGDGAEIPGTIFPVFYRIGIFYNL
ncbi:MAG: hypothetical protein K9G42_11580 [Pedobacter sp.]|nr:hypothetical protein [Pedobacter sp.]